MLISNFFSLFTQCDGQYDEVSLHKQFDGWERGQIEKYPMHRYQIVVDNTVVGSIDFRQANDPWLYWGGHIGYNIAPNYRGNHYAYKACMALKPIMESYCFDSVIITASPDNLASIKTILKLGCEFLEETTVPQDHWLMKQNEPIKRIYKWHLDHELK